MDDPIYLDYAASTPCDPRVIEEILPYFSQNCANASNLTHELGKKASQAIEIARYQVANLLKCLTQQIIWTSGATESNNLAILGSIRAFRKKYPSRRIHIITSSIEHKSVLGPCEKLTEKNIEVSYIKPTADGIILPDQIKNIINESTFLVSLMMANNETGVINDLSSISKICQEENVLLHTDATQFAGKLPIDLQRTKIDLLSISGHKLYATKGVGALFVRDFSIIEPIIYGGGQEEGYRSGTLNVPGIVGLGKACQICAENYHLEAGRMLALIRNFENIISSFDSRIQINCSTASRLPNITSVTFPVKEGYNILNRMKAIACSSGSACESADNTPSHVMMSLGKTSHQAKNTLRFSIGRFTQEKEIFYAANYICDVLKKIS